MNTLLSLLASVVAAHTPQLPSKALLSQAIVGARIEVGDGRVIERGTIVMRDGLIVSVAEGVAVPPGAEVLDGKGLTVYPGFIDAGTFKGIKLPDPRPTQDEPLDT